MVRSKLLIVSLSGECCACVIFPFGSVAIRTTIEFEHWPLLTHSHNALCSFLLRHFLQVQ